MQTAPLPWRLWQKVIFRFTFLLLGSSTYFCWVMMFYFADSASPRLAFNPTSPFKLLVGPFFWLDRHIFHTGYDPKIHDAFPQDDHFGVVFYLSLVLLAIIGTLTWSLLDKKRQQYDRLLFWFRLYIRYILAMIMFAYGIFKFIPVQMTYPSIVDLLTPLGEQTKFTILWNFMGVAPGYMMLTGLSEIAASLLLLNRRSLVLGYLVQLGVLINVVAFNLLYNVPVKMFSTQLLIYDLFLISPYCYRLFQLFFGGQAVALTEPGYTFLSRGEKYGLAGVLAGMPFLLFCLDTVGANRIYNQEQANVHRQKLYEVTSFIATDTLPPLLTDTLRWKRFAFAYTSYAVIFDMKDKKDFYECDADSSKRTFTLHDGKDTLHWPVFHYTYPTGDQLQLSGKWKGRDIKVSLRSIPIDSMVVNKEKAKWVLD